MTFCVTTKKDGSEKFLVLSCDGEIVDKKDNLKEAEYSAETVNACYVVKVLRTCDGMDVGEVDQVMSGEEVVEAEEIEE